MVAKAGIGWQTNNLNPSRAFIIKTDALEANLGAAPRPFSCLMNI